MRVIKSAKLALSTLLIAFIVVTGFASLSSAAAGSTEIWLDIDTKALSLTVMQGQTMAIVFENIAIGSNGATWNKQLNDEQTPLGDFTITEVRTSNRFNLFMPINYPNRDHAKRAFENGHITAAEYEMLIKAFNRGGPPPQNTSLGGHVGIHGLGAGSLEVHQRFNWTNGCIALTNEQVEELAQWVNPGTRVLIR
jgi:murein L,D-transpeptidase YafK